MVKINLLDSVTERPEGGVAVIEKKAANPNVRLIIIGVGVACVMLLAMVFDFAASSFARSAMQSELAKQQEIKRQMDAIIKEQAELERKTKDIEARINAIKKLRASQQGPVAVLSAINERIPQSSEFFLESVEQKAGDLIISGNSPSEAAVTQFGRSLEFSSGLFTNVNIETQRTAFQGMSKIAETPTPGKPDTKPETVSFKIRCRYTPPAPTMPTNPNQQQQQQPKVAAANGSQQSPQIAQVVKK